MADRCNSMPVPKYLNNCSIPSGTNRGTCNDTEKIIKVEPEDSNKSLEDNQRF